MHDDNNNKMLVISLPEIKQDSLQMSSDSS